MRVFYLCPTGRHTSLTAAALHMHLIEPGIGRKQAIQRIKGFAEFRTADIGRPFFVGTDSAGNEVYTIGVQNEPVIAVRAAHDLIRLTGAMEGQFRIVDTTRTVSRCTRVAVFLRKAGLGPPARILERLGLSREIPRLTGLMGCHPSSGSSLP